MLKNYFLVAWRNLYRHPIFALINITGLTLGVGFAILVLQYINYQSSFDRHYSNSENTYRVTTGHRWLKGEDDTRLIMPKTMAELKEKMPEVRYAASYTRPDNYDITLENEVFEDSLSFVNSDFFRVFDVPVIRGDATASMDTPFSMALPETLAKKYFNSVDVVGRTLTVDGEHLFTVAAVIADFPNNTHLANGLFASHRSKAWRGINTNTSAEPYRYRLTAYLQFRGGKPDDLAYRLNTLYQEEVAQWRQGRNGQNNRPPQSLGLQALTDIHFSEAQHQARKADGKEVSLVKVTYGMATTIALGLVVLVLGISCCNYIYLSIARSSQRGKEVAMRKVAGASRQQVFWQFICESLVITVIAVLLALLLAWLLRPLVADFAGVDESSFSFANLRFLAMLLALALVTALLAGLYPALALSGISPLQALFGARGALGQFKLRRVLVISQFGVATLLLMITLFVFQQLSWLEDADMGFESDNVIVVENRFNNRSGDASSQQEALRDQLIQHPSIAAAAISDGGPTRYWGLANSEVTVLGGSKTEITEFSTIGIGPQFTHFYQPRLLAGRLLDTSTYPADKTEHLNGNIAKGGAVMLTRTGLKLLEISNPKQVVGKTVEVKDIGFMGQGGTEDLHQFTVVGVIDDLNFGTGSSGIYPHMLMTSFRFPGSFVVRTTGVDNAAATEAISQVAKEVFPQSRIRTVFLQDHYQRESAALRKLGNGFTAVTFISVLISCLGLYAIAAFTVERRTKEVGVRKAIGATVSSILRLLMWDFTKPVLAAIAVAIPVGTLVIFTMLQYMPSHASVGAGLYVQVVIAVLLVAWLTVLSHTARTALSSPTRALRYE